MRSRISLRFGTKAGDVMKQLNEATITIEKLSKLSEGFCKMLKLPRSGRSNGCDVIVVWPASAVFASKWSRKQNQLNFHVNLWPKSEPAAVRCIDCRCCGCRTSQNNEIAFLRWLLVARKTFPFTFFVVLTTFWTKTNCLVNDKVVIEWKCFPRSTFFFVWCFTWRHKLRDN